MQTDSAVRFALIAVLMVGLSARLQALGAIGATTVAPTMINIDTATQITVTAAISDPALIPGSVNLLRLDKSGQATILGTLHDDGTNGDDFAGDHVYSIQLTFREAQPGEIPLQVSAAFKGLLGRTKATLRSVFVQSTNGPMLTVTTLADALDKGDTAAAKQLFSQDTHNIMTLDSLDDQDRHQLALGLRSANCQASNTDYQVCTLSWTHADGTTTAVEISMTAVAGRWIIIGW